MFKKINLSSISFNFIILSIGTFLGRILGYVREIYIIKTYGINEVSDNLNFLLISPDFINNFFSWSIIVSTVMPFIIVSNNYKVLNKIRNKILFIAFFLYAFYILYYLFNSDENFIAISIISGTIFFNIYFSFTLVISQKNNNFLFTSLANFLYNLSVILALIVSGDNLIFISIIILFFSLFRFYISKFYNIYKGFNLSKQSYSKLLNLNFKSILLAIISQSVLGLVFLIDKFYASNLQEGSLTLYSLIEKLYLAPITIVIVSSLSARYPLFIEIISDFNNRKLDYFNFFKRNILLSLFLSFALFLSSPFIKYFFLNFIGIELNEINIIIYHFKILLFDLIPYSLILFFVNHLLAQKKYSFLLVITLVSIISKYIMLELFADSLFNIIVLNILNHLLTLLLIITLFYKYEKNILSYLWRRSLCYN